MVVCSGFGRECVAFVCVQGVCLGNLGYRVRMANATNPRGLYSGFALWVLGFRVRKSIATKREGGFVQGLRLRF